MARAKKAGQDASHLFAANKARGGEIKALEADLDGLEARRRAILLTIPNLPHETVPVGASAADNVEVRKWGEPPVFDFEPKSHVDLGVGLGIVDFERATRMSGARFAIMYGAGARLGRALIDFMLDLHTREHGYIEVDPPFLVNAAALVGTGNLPKFEPDLFKIAGEWDLYLIPTAEVPLTNLHREEIVDGRLLPRRYTAYTPCFRSEAGFVRPGREGPHPPAPVPQGGDGEVRDTRAVDGRTREHGRQRRGRAAAPRPAVPDGAAVHRRHGVRVGEDVYDIEVWLPSQHTYREISSCSNTMSFQARRANIKYRPDGTGKAEYAHTLNGSGLAVGRTLIAIIENFQQRDGSVIIPEALRPYMGGLERITRKD